MALLPVGSEIDFFFEFLNEDDYIDVTEEVVYHGENEDGMGKDWDLAQKAELVIYHQTVRPLFDMLGVCRLPWIELGFDENTYAEFYSAVTGITFNLDELLKKSNDLYNVTRTINMNLSKKLLNWQKPWLSRQKTQMIFY